MTTALEKGRGGGEAIAFVNGRRYAGSTALVKRKAATGLQLL